MTQTEQLIASLAALDNTNYQPGDNQYIDWSSRNADGIVSFEVGTLGGGADDIAAAVDLTRDQMLALQQRLTAWLLANPA